MNQRRKTPMATTLLVIGFCLMTTAEVAAQQDDDSSAIVWWVIGTGGILNAGNSDGDTLSATLGQTGVDSTSLDDSSYGKIGYGRPRSAMTTYLGFWLPRFRKLDESLPPAVDGVGAFALSSQPNPFIERTTISYTLPHDADVRVEVVDAAGRRVRLLVDMTQPAGDHRIEWDGSDDGGGVLPSGAYVYRLEVTSGATHTSSGMLYLVR